MSESNEFDYIVVGGGTAAGILAYRLGAANYKVCVLEAGPSDKNPFIRIPAGFNKTLNNSHLTWQFKSDPEPNISNRSILYAQGRTLGGSSSINGMIYNRGQAADFDGWAEAGNIGWSYKDVLPLFRRTENRITDSDESDPDPIYRGFDGPLTVTTTKWPTSLERAFYESARNLGFTHNPDYNGAFQDGFGAYQSSIHRGWRVSTASAFLHPARKNFSVDIRCNAIATSIEFDELRANGVVYLQGNKLKSVKATREIIIAAGALNSPKLLQLSGIGPRALLRQHKIDVRVELQGVGENLRDHFTPRLQIQAKPGLVTMNQEVSWFKLIKQLVRWSFGFTSILSISPGRAYIFGKSNPELKNPDYVILFAPASYKSGRVGVLDDFPGFTLGVWQMRPKSSGYVRISSKDAMVHPNFNLRYLSHSEDSPVLLAAIRAARKLLATEPLASLVQSEILPGIDLNSDDELIGFARSYGATSYHLVGSCKMGSRQDISSVVDPRLRVHNIKGLRVADASIMPTIPSANTAAATMMIAEKAADLILEDSRQVKT